MSKICSKIRIKTPERRCSDVFIVNFEHIWRLFLVFAFMISSMCLFARVYSFLRSKNGNVRKQTPYSYVFYTATFRSRLWRLLQTWESDNLEIVGFDRFELVSYYKPRATRKKKNVLRGRCHFYLTFKPGLNQSINQSLKKEQNIKQKTTYWVMCEISIAVITKVPKN